MRKLLLLILSVMVTGAMWAQSDQAVSGSLVPSQRGQMKVDGADATEFIITSDEDWQTFTSNADQYASCDVKLDADIYVTTMFEAAFTGIFDGQGHSILFEDGFRPTADFALFKSSGEGATFRNFEVKGTLTMLHKYAGVVLEVNGPTTIQNVKVSADVTSSGYPLSGFVVYNKSQLDVTGCEFSGSLKCTQSASADIAGFISSMSGESAFKFKNSACTGKIELSNGNSVAGWRASGFVSSNTSTLVADCEFTNCLMSGEIIQANGSERLGGLVGSPNTDKSSYVMKGCLITGTVKRWNSNTDPTLIVQQNCLVLGCSTWKSMGTNTVAENCYYTTSTEMNETVMNQFKMVDDADVSSGALCYNLNGDQSSIGWYQNLTEDATPVLDNTHMQVYASGRKHCDGTDYEGVTYNNESGSTTQDEHNFVDGVCDYCGEMVVEDGFVLISGPASWNAWVGKLRSGAMNTSAKMTSDLAVTEKLPDGFCGTFDGQGHTISINIGAESGKYALFGTLASCTIRNLVIEGELTGESNTAPVASYVNGETLLENIITKVNVTQTTLNDGNCSGMIGMASNKVTIRNCISASTVKATKDAGGFVGWAGGQTINMENCAMIGDVTVNTGASSVFLRIRHSDCMVTMTNCYYVPCTPTILSGNGTEMAVTATQIQNSDVESGMLCYALNGDQSNINFYQTLPDDEMPTVNATHGQVYANGRKHCDGTDYDDLYYSNEEGTTEVDEHNYDNGVCDYCGALKLNENGQFEINDYRTMAAFTKAVNAGNYSLNAILVEDIYDLVMGGIGSECEMIGISQPYCGTFDGQGHTLGVNVDANGGDGGVFAKASDATIKNLTVEGTIRNGGQTGFIGNNTAGSPVLQNIIIKLDIEGTLNVGGVCGNSNNGNKALTMENVMFAGKVKYVGNANQNGIGGFVGWAYDTKFTMNNCIMIGDIDLGAGTTPAQILRVRSTCTVASKDCAYIPVEGIRYINGNNAEMDATPVACEDAADGSVCYAANGSSWQSPIWYQTIGDDDIPVLDATHSVVYPCAEGYASRTKDQYADIVDDLTAEAEAATDPEEHPAQKTLVEDYLDALNVLSEVTSFEELVAAYYPVIAEKRQTVDASIAAYEVYKAKVEATRQYLQDNADDFKGGPAYQKLESYLSEDITDPDEDEFPNGSYAYIIDVDNLQLDVEGINVEIAFITQMLEDALNEGLNPGADATSFLVNADFSDGLNGWEGDKIGSVSKGETIDFYVVEHWTNKSFDLNQTVTLPENGLYEVVMNGAYRVGGEAESDMHAAMLYMNENQTFLQSTIEDVISADEAVDKENSWITGDIPDYQIKDEDDNVIAYVPHGAQSAAYAFNAGRYENRLVVNVTDGTLKVGVRNPHQVYADNDWTDFGNFRLRYLGTMEEVGDAMDATVSSMCARAKHILATNPNEVNYRFNPNYYNALRTELQSVVEAAEAASAAEKKYESICQMGEIFGRIYECQKNYADLVAYSDAMSKACEMLRAVNAITEEEDAAAYEMISKTQSGYYDGRYTNEEAAAGGDLKNISFYPTQEEDGSLKIADAKDLNVFAAMVSTGMTDLNVNLEADVVADEGFITIGGNTSGTDYKYNGTFDGKGHTLTVNIDNTGVNQVGVFRHTGDATIKNVKFTGSIKGANNTGLVGQIDGMTRFENVESNLDIYGGNNVGGFAGAAYSGPQYFDNCLFSGRVEAYTNGAGGFYGWSATNVVYADNSLSIGEVVGDQSAYFFRVKCDGTVGIAGAAGCYVYGGNMYFLRTSDPSVLVSGTPLWWGEFLTDVILEVDANDLASGKVCHTLNAGNEENPAWRQTLKVDDSPLLNSDHLQVFFSEEKGYYNNVPDAVTSVEEGNAANGNACFDLTGRKVQRPVKGIYIIGGRKILVR
ncbi:MAG: hypothetical protein ACI4B5_06665 [Bacteroidaceae bacterium]